MIYEIIAFFLAAISSLSLVIFMTMCWARFWPRVPSKDTEKLVNEVKVGDRRVWIVTVKYHYFHQGEKYEGNTYFLFGVRPFSSKEKAEEAEIPDRVFVCPVSANISYLRQDQRTFWFFLGAAIFGYIVTPFIFLLS